MRTTLTLDDDVATKLKAEARRAGRPFRDVVNETIRRGLASRQGAGKHQPFKVTPHDFGKLKLGVSFDNIGELIEQVEGPLHR
jgi:hypothetical protein